MSSTGFSIQTTGTSKTSHPFYLQTTSDVSFFLNNIKFQRRFLSNTKFGFGGKVSLFLASIFSGVPTLIRENCSKSKLFCFSRNSSPVFICVVGEFLFCFFFFNSDFSITAQLSSNLGLIHWSFAAMAETSNNVSWIFLLLIYFPSSSFSIFLGFVRIVIS